MNYLARFGISNNIRGWEGVSKNHVSISANDYTFLGVALIVVITERISNKRFRVVDGWVIFDFQDNNCIVLFGLVTFHYVKCTLSNITISGKSSTNSWRKKWRAMNFYIGQAKKKQEKFDILSKYAIFRSLLIYSIWFVINGMRIASDWSCHNDFLKIETS